MIESPGITGKTDIRTTRTRLPIKTVLMDKSFSVLDTAVAPFSFMDLTLSLNDEMIVGIVFNNVYMHSIGKDVLR